MGYLRSFLFAPSARIHAQDTKAIRLLLPKLPASELIEGAYRRSDGRQASFYFAQGIVVGALGNLFASSLGHFIDRSAGPWNWPDVAWGFVGVLSIGVMVAMTAGSVSRYRHNSQVEQLFLQELRRRGGSANDDRDDPDELFVRGPT